MKQRFTLLVLAVLFVAASSYAQVPAAQHRGAADIISAQPEGNKVLYSRSGSAYGYSMYSGLYYTDLSGALGSVVFGADNKVYFKDIASQFSSNTWVEGTIEGSQIKISLPQTIWDSGDGYCIEVVKMKLNAARTAFERTDDQTVTLNYNATTGVISTPALSNLKTGNEIIGLSYDDDLSWAGYGDWDVAYKKVTDPLVEVPAGLSAETYSLTAEGYTGSLVHVGFDGNDVYVQGIDPNLPDTWVKGTIDGNKVTFKCGQYVGADEVAGNHEYLYSATAEEKYDDYYEEYYTEYTLSDADITFDYDAATKTLSNSSLFLLNGGKTAVSYLSVFDKATIAPFSEVAATPAAPVVSIYEGGYDYFSDGYGWGCLYIDLNTTDVNGNYILPQKVSYKLWVKVNGEEKPLQLSKYDYKNMVDESMDEIPFDYSDGWDIGNSETNKYIYYYVIGPEAYGVQTIYRGGGEVHASEISWVAVKDLGAELQPAAATPAYPDASIGASDNKIDYGFYTGSEDITVATNNLKPETYDIAVKFSDPALVGTLIESVTFPLQEVEGVSDISVFLTSQLRVENGKNAADLVVKSVTPAEAGFITVTLDKPYTIPEGGVYVGYSLTVNSVEKPVNLTPINVISEYNDGGYYLHTSDGILKWLDFGQLTNTSAMVQVKLAGSGIKSNAAAIEYCDTLFFKTGEAITVPLTVVNHGANGIQSLDVTYSIAGQNGSQHFDTAVAGFYGKSAQIKLDIPAIAEMGGYGVVVKVDKVNAVANEDADNSVLIPVVALNTMPKKRTLLEEYTGTWCGWCPRGYVGLEKLAELYPDEYVLVSYHNGDDMEIMQSSLYPSPVTGFPDAWMDRATEVDAYYGVEYGVKEFGIADDLADNNKQFGYADINLSSKLSDDQSTVNIEAAVVFPYKLTANIFKVEYILTSDGLTNASWGQSNYYAGGGSGTPLYMDQFTKTEDETVYGLVFNDVAVMTSEMLGGSKSIIKTADADVPVNLSYAFSLADAVNTNGFPVIQDVQKLKVVALLIDAGTGKVVNAKVAKLGDTAGISIIEVDNRSKSAAYFDLQGRRVVKPAKGLYIHNGRKLVIK